MRIIFKYQAFTWPPPLQDSLEIATQVQPTSQPLDWPQHVDRLTLPASIGIAAIIGAILRRGLLDLFSTPAGPVFAVLAPNMLGCFIMGFSQPFKSTLLAYYPPAFPAITTGIPECQLPVVTLINFLLLFRPSL
jgi:hypothetical protein